MTRPGTTDLRNNPTDLLTETSRGKRYTYPNDSITTVVLIHRVQRSPSDRHRAVVCNKILYTKHNMYYLLQHEKLRYVESLP